MTVNDGTSDIAVLTAATAGMTGDDGDGILEPGETWSWTFQVTIWNATTFTATGTGTDSLGNSVTYPDYPEEQDDVTVETVGATRTLGFWKTHLEFTTYVFENYTNGSIDLGWKNITSMEEMMGIFWADVPRNSDGSKRDNLCKAKLQVSWQATAAILNDAMPGGAPLPVSLEEIQSILSGDNINDIRALGRLLDEYNNSGDNIALDPILPPTGRADPNGARDIADYAFADC